MSSHDSKYAKRKLDFHDKPFDCKSFYIDIKAETARRKIVRRIKDLGGTVEGFLSKDIDLFITDKKNGDLSTTCKEVKTKSIQISSNLSRGRALLMKSNATTKNRRGSTNGNDIVQNAINLGVKVQQINIFLKESNKYVNCLKKVVKKAKNDIDGITPLTWTDNDKENKCCIKVEDTEQLYKPLIKHFDTFPHLIYSDEVASPFVKGVVLTKQTEKNINRYSTAKKTAPVSNKEGYCEACDYWYRCSLREHIKSAKHEKFVKDQTNFQNLDDVINKLPSLSDFLFKLDDLTRKVKSCFQIQHDTISDQCKGDKSCIEKNSDEMPSLDKELTVDRNIEQKLPNEHIMTEMSSCISQRIETLESEMPSLHKENLYDTNTQDSGTGPELLDNESALNFTFNSKHSINESKIKRLNSDSAIAPDDIPVCGTTQIDIDCTDDLSQQCTNVLLQNVTTHVRIQFSQISLVENKLETSENSDTMSYSHGNYCSGNNMVNFNSKNNNGSVCSYDFSSSPNSKSQHQFNFKDLASNWIMDMGNTFIDCKETTENEQEKTIAEDMNCDYSGSTEELNPENYKQFFSQGKCCMGSDYLGHKVNGHNDNIAEHHFPESPDVKCDKWQCLASKHPNSDSLGIESMSTKQSDESYVNLCENSYSVESRSLLSMADTPNARTFSKVSDYGLSENSSSLQSFPYEPDNILCNSESNNSDFSVISERTPFSQRKMNTCTFDINSENFTSSSKQEPIKIKINLSDIKKKEKKKKRKIKVKRRIFPEVIDHVEKENNQDQSFYQTQQQGEMKIKLCKVVKTPTCSQKNGNLMTYWKVRKSGGCRLIFSSEKRKANDTGHSDAVSKRRKCIF